MITEIKKEIKNLLKANGVNGEIELTAPPKSDMGDLAFACFGLAKEFEKNPVEIAKEIVEKIVGAGCDLPACVEKIEAIGPYVNFYLNAKFLAAEILKPKTLKPLVKKLWLNSAVQIR